MIAALGHQRRVEAELSRQLNILNQVSAKATELAAPRPAATGPTPAQPRVTLRR